MRHALALALLVLSTHQLLALDPHKQLSQYGLESWQAKQGMANGGILCIAQSTDGYLWLGTRRGLIRFNGVEFQLYDRKASGGLIGWNVNHIEARRDGSLLFSTEGGVGLIEFRNGNFSAYPLPKLPERSIRVFHEARDGTLWIGTNGSGLFQIAHGKLTPFDSAVIGSTVKAITEAHDGAIWVGTYGDGVTRLQGTQITRYDAEHGLPSNDVRAILEDPDGAMWFSTLAGLVRLQAGHFTPYTKQQGLSHDRPFPLVRDRAGSLWIGTEGGGLNRMVASQFSALNSKTGLTSDEIRCLFEDHEGNLWIGSADGSLYRLKDEKFTAFTSREGLRSDLVRAVYEDRDRNIWAGTSEGLNYLRDGVVFQPKENWGSGTVTSILRDKHGALWVGTLGHGLRWVQGGKVQVFYPDRIISSILEHQDGSIWASVVHGMVRIQDGKAVPIGVGTPLADVRIGGLRQDAAGTVWAASDSGIIYEISANLKIRTISAQQGGCSSAVTSLLPDTGTNGIWIGTTEGLCRFEEGKFQRYLAADGLIEDRVSSILDDDRGYLWLSGYRGFSRIEKAALRRFRSGEGKQLPVWFLEHANGEPTSNGFQMRSAWKGSDGRLWFASLRGLILIDPQTAQPDPVQVPIVIEAMLADRAVLPRNTAAYELPARVRDVEFRFVGLNLGNPSGVRFKYQLEGYDADWIDAGNRREAFYTNLPARRYQFRVLAANSDGVWTGNAATLSFSKSAHLYERWDMRLLFLAVLGLTGWLAYRARVAGMQRQFTAVLAERNRIARELHDTVEQGMTGVLLQLDTVAAHWPTQPDRASRGLELARNMARHCMIEARNAVRDLRSESHGDLVAELQEMASRLETTGAPAIQLKVQGPPRNLPREAAITMLRIGQEAVTNAIKHARATRIEIAVLFDTAGVALQVCDNGVGFIAQSTMASASSGHFGLLGMRERANKVRGKLEIQSNPSGTVVHFRLDGTHS